jgi:hypothetical protein
MVYSKTIFVAYILVYALEGTEAPITSNIKGLGYLALLFVYPEPQNKRDNKVFSQTRTSRNKL